MDDLQRHYGAPDAKIAGLAIWVHGYEFVDSNEYSDGNWLRVTAHCGASGATVRVRGSIMMTLDILGFRNDCELLLANHATTAKLEPLEPELKVTVEKADSLGHLTMRVDITPDNMTQQHSMLFEIDQSYLPATIAACTRILQKFPVRGAVDKTA